MWNKKIIKTMMGGVILLMCAGILQAKTMRPLETEDATTLPQGQVDLSISLDYRDDYTVPYTPVGSKGDYFELPKLEVTVGVSERVEVQAKWSAVKVSNPNFDEYGAGDPKIYTKINIIQESETCPAIGIRFGFKVPSADNEKGLGTDEADIFAETLVSKKFGPVSAHLNLGVGILGDPKPNHGQDDVLTYAFALEMPIADNFEIGGEIIGQALSNDENDRSLARIGARYNMGDSLTLDGSVGAGLTDETENFRADIGVTYHWKAF